MSLLPLLSISLLLLSIHSYSSPICQPFKCGNLNISYPFSLYDNNHQHCGLPGFLISCHSNITILHLQSNIYTVQSIDYDNHTISLVDTDVLDSNDTCPRVQHNVSFFADSGMQYTSLDVNLTFFFECEEPLNYTPITCLSSVDNGDSYVFYSSNIDPYQYAQWSAWCHGVVMAPVLSDYLNQQNLTDGYGAALKQGFQLGWNSTDSCAKCEKLLGQCGYTLSGDNSTYRFNCYCANGTCAGKKSHTGVVIGISVTGAVASSFALCAFFFLFRCRNDQNIWLIGTEERKREKIIELTLESFESLAPKRYTFFEIRKMTKSFSQIIGQGGYGSVFKGKLTDGSPVAVKVFKDRESNGIEFINEVASIARTSHVNIVRLLGFSMKGSKRALIYEFMPNGSLDKYLRENQNSESSHMKCTMLFQIAVGIARGLEYLHRGCNTRIVHFDIKPHNILLDQDYCPKISDFGLAKFSKSKESILSISGMRGTIGYIAPEVFSRNFGVVSSKSDVYSYGMMVLEMFGGKQQKVEAIDSSTDTYFPDCIYKCLEENTICHTYGILEASEETVRKAIIVGLWCIQMMPDARPTMRGVLDMLDRSIQDLTLPPKFSLSLPPIVAAIDSTVSTPLSSETCLYS